MQVETRPDITEFQKNQVNKRLDGAVDNLVPFDEDLMNKAPAKQKTLKYREMINEIRNDKSKMAMQYDTLLCAAIYKILDQNWKDDMQPSEFSAFWCGYDALSDCLYEEGFRAVTTAEMKHDMQCLKEKGAVELRPAFDCDYKLCGSGWFSCA